MICTYCGKEISSLIKYIVHIEYAHNIYHTYECPFSDCSRSFHRRDVFKKHVILNHESNIAEQKTSHNQDCNNMSFEKPFKSDQNDCYVPSSFSEEQNKGKKNINFNSKYAEFETVLKKTVLELISKLYLNSSLPRSIIQQLIEYIKSFLQSGIFSLLQDILILLFDNENAKINDFVKEILNKIINSVNFMDTDYKRMKYFTESQCYVTPILKTIGFSEDTSKKNNETALILKERFSVYVPICKSLQLFLELPNVLRTILEYHNFTYVKKSFLEPDSDQLALKNILDGSLWKDQLSKNKEKLVLPLSIYFDDFEVCNPLGSHAGVYKLGAVYFSISSLSPQYSSRLENIFIALIFHSIERSEFGNRSVFTEFLNSLKKLETEGIDIKSENRSIKVYFNIALITGDNLGVHSIFGYSQTFSSGSCCRFCTSPKSVQETQIRLNSSDERLEAMYLNHVNQKSFNVKEYCIWNDLNSFHVYRNHSVDLMHDLYEGVYRYDMALIVKSLIQQNMFSLLTLNNRVKYFEYDEHEKNKPPPVKKEHLQNEIIIFSASEMLSFVKNFRYYVGDLVTENNDIWKFYLSLLEITEILIATEISIAKIDKLKLLLENHLKFYLSLFPGKTLKPKHHLLLHYPDVIRKTGPVSKTHCLRFEAKHRDLKKYANNIETRKNIPLSLAKKMQMQFACRSISNIELKDNITFGPEIHDAANFDSYKFSNETDVHFLKKCIAIKWYQKNGITYRKNQVLRCKATDGVPQFGHIQNILIESENFKNCYMICQLLDTVELSVHYRAYVVNFTDRYISLDINSLNFYSPTLLQNIHNLKLVSF